MELLLFVLVIVIFYGNSKLSSLERVVVSWMEATLTTNKENNELSVKKESFIDEELERLKKEHEEWRLEAGYMGPEVSYELQNRQEERRWEHFRAYFHKGNKNTFYPVFSESEIAWKYLKETEYQEELHEWWSTLQKEVRKDVLEHSKKGTGKKGFKLGYITEHAIQEIIELPIKRDLVRKAYCKMIQLNIDVMRGVITIEKAMSNEDDFLEDISHNKTSVLFNKSLKKKYEEMKKSYLDQSIENWNEYIKEAENPEEGS